MPVPAYVPVDPEREEWDVIVVGTGMGGSTVGYELARRGRRVLFLEKGKLLHGGPEGLGAPPPEADPTIETRLRAGRWPQPLLGKTTFGDVSFIAPWGCGSGGSTALYGAQLERFARADFEPKAHFPRVRDSSLPERWPITYDELAPYYRLAEAIYRVRGTQDPLNPDPQASLLTPPPLSERDQVFCDSFRELGLHPYRSHVGFDYSNGCRECLELCVRGCKSDAGSSCLMPALTIHGARILPECEVLELVADRSRVNAVRARWNGGEGTLSAKVVVLAAGSLMTPILLMNSRSSDWPEGLANRTGLVGRNLMLHVTDFLAIDQRTWTSDQGPARTLSLNDFYVDEGEKLGSVQSLGLQAAINAPFIQGYLRLVEEKDPRWWRTLARPFLPLVANVMPKILRRASMFATIVEDVPYHDNQVYPDSTTPNGMRFTYSYRPELRQRSRRLVQRLRATLGAQHRIMVVTGGRHNLNYGHVCGTCRFGDDPRTSVLDASNRAHEVENLYVTDASYFPSSGGTNPSLTVAANALRVGEIIDGRLA